MKKKLLTELSVKSFVLPAGSSFMQTAKGGAIKTDPSVDIDCTTIHIPCHTEERIQ
ncbi:hypothetical protein AB9P05_07710 [Roseivirga sp. BDSF3-8]|uniref:hypothetical protein n=1 Tax=Roseivirga sp. BDSF3-8 TaxID=3241598 RepID=UPI0035323664